MKLKKLKTRQGFTLVEIMIVVGIIILLAAISIHGLLRARVNANDGAAVGSAKSIATALESYKTVNPGVTKDFNVLINAQPPYLSAAFQDGNHQGYDFSIYIGEGGVYCVYAQPEHYGVTGTKFIIYDQAGLQRFDDYEAAISFIPTGLGQTLQGGPPPPPGYNPPGK